MAIKILIIINQEIIREGLRTILAADRHFTVVGSQSKLFGATVHVEDVNPDVIIIVGGKENNRELIAIIEDLSRRGDAKKILILTDHSDLSVMEGTVKMGVHAYVMKDAGIHEIKQAIHNVAAGQAFMDAELLGMTLNERKLDADGRLTDRQIEILRMVSQGDTNRVVARTLRLSERTIKSQMTQIFNTLNVGNRSEAVAKAVKGSLI